MPTDPDDLTAWYLFGQGNPPADYRAHLPLTATLVETTQAGVGVWRVDGDGPERWIAHLPGDVPEWICFGCLGRACLHLPVVWAAWAGRGGAE